MQRGQAAAGGLAPLFEARSIALIGASDRRGSLGDMLLGNLTGAGFRGPVYPVNPRHRSVQGQTCYASLERIGKPVDLAVIATPAAAVPEVLAECGAHGVPVAVVLSAGFREAGDAGRSLEDAALEAARRHGLRFIGPNCLGVMRPAIGLNATFSQGMARPGRIALVSQSGAMCTAMLDWAEVRDIGFSCVVSSGIAADVDFGEILDYLVIDTLTRAIMLYVEGVRDARRFMSALRAASRAKPVIVMKTGRYAEGGRAARSHTGALPGDDDVFDAALERAGVVRVQNYSNCCNVAETLHAGTRTQGPRLTIVTNGGGPGVIAADCLADRRQPVAGLSAATRKRLDDLLPAAWSGDNPVDVLGDAGAERYAAAVGACLDDPNSDAVLAMLVPQAMTDPAAVAEAVARLAGDAAKPVLTCWMGDASMAAGRKLLRRHGVPGYETPESAVAAFAAMAAYRANQESLLQVPEPIRPRATPDTRGAKLIVDNAQREGREFLDVVESKALLSAFGIPIVASVPARDAAEAVVMAEKVGYPVAMKIHAADIVHKSDVDGVRLGIGNGEDLRSAFRELLRNAARHSPEAAVRGVLIERFWRPESGRELMLGVANDRVFGPVISVGLGGTMVEVYRDRAVGLPPLNRFLARRMIAGTRAARYLDEFRGKPAASRSALEDAILCLSDLVCELPWIEELDVNPLLVDEHEARALDARIRLRRVPATAGEYRHLAIHPYPVGLIERHVLADGTCLAIRPIRPEDAPLEKEFVDGLSERSKYLRFMYAFREITPQMVSRFTQIDYDREMALVVIVNVDGRDRQIAVARYTAGVDSRSCEFAIVVADEWQHRGIATELLRRLIGIARERRFERMYGTVLRENRGMLGLARQLGFEQRVAPDDPQLVLLSLEL